MRPKSSDAKPRGSFRRRGLGCLLILPVLSVGLWIAIHRVDWLGPTLADAGRSVVGNEAISQLEDYAYAAQDRYNQWSRSGEAPKAYWEIPEAAAAELPEKADEAPKDDGSTLPGFALTDVPPMHDSFSAPGDGRWIAIEDARHPGEPPRMQKTLLHPDRNRSWTAVVVVAMDLRQVALRLVVGRREPESKMLDARKYDRRALIAPEHMSSAIAAFNGGFKTTHGQYGMMVDGVTFVRPRIGSCSIAMLPKGQLTIGSWKKIRDDQDEMVWFRQTPQCMVEAGELHVGLRVEGNTHWGATVDRNTVIRRSALGVSKNGEVLYYGIGDHTTARAIGQAMHHAGAHDVAQLDVNFSYPKFLTVEARADGELYVEPIADGFEYSDSDYVRKRSERDFFYVTRTPHDEILASLH